MRTHATTKVEISKDKNRVAKCPFKNTISTNWLIQLRRKKCV